MGDKEVYIDALIARARDRIGAEAFGRVLEQSTQAEMLADISEDLGEFGVAFDRWYSERALEKSGAIDRALARLERESRLYARMGRPGSAPRTFGDEKDRVVVRENGQKTYFASDIAYPLEKRERGFQRLIDVLGADHHGYVRACGRD